MTEIGDKAERVGRAAEDHEWLDRGIRFGMLAYGVVHLVVAWLAIQLALGDHSQQASNKGAMQTLAHQSAGPLILWLIAVGMFLLVIWRVLEAAFGHTEYDGGKRLRKRLVSAGKAVIYGYVGYTAVKVVTGSATSKGKSTTAKLMDAPAGQLLVGAVGIAIIAYGVFMIRRGWTEKFLENLDAEGKSGDEGKAYRYIGKAGYIAKGVSFVVIGGLFGYAAISHEPKKSGGLDSALHTVLQQPFGPVLLFLIAIGIACYGLFCFARARYLST
ncbi:MAG: DUF1206 domain-containing protein [Nocardioides sp.]